MRALRAGAGRARGRDRDERADPLDPPAPAPLRDLPRDGAVDALLAHAADRAAGAVRVDEPRPVARPTSSVLADVRAAVGASGRPPALVGLCLSGAGAGAACVMTGALPAPPLIAHHERSPRRRREAQGEEEGPDRRRLKAVGDAARRTRRRACTRPTATPAPTSTPKAKAKATRKTKPVVEKKKTVVDEFGIEGAHARERAGQPTRRDPSSVGGGGLRAETQRRGRRRWWRRRRRRSRAGGEFGIEG